MKCSGGSIVWLASYLKSGNTWLRAMLTALLDPDGQTPDLNALVGGTELTERQFLDDCCGVSSADLPREQLLRYLRTMRLVASSQAVAPAFVKTHDRFGATGDGLALFPAEASRAAICIARHPFDVAVSLAAHYGSCLDEAIARMADPGYGLNLAGARGSELLPIEVGSWSEHVTSWLDQQELPVLLLRYEDMLADPAAALAEVVALSGLQAEPSAIKAAAAACAFERLQAAEAMGGFTEKPAGMPRFFRTGKARIGEELSIEQRATIVETHSPAMNRLGYATKSA
jgi:aryl sulfotransferase